MIYLSTGGNGAGKTLFTLKDVREQQLKENRPVYFHGFTPKQILLDWGWQEFDPKKWQDLPDGSICVMDECQNEFPHKIQGELPEYINAVAQFRRKRGFDFWMITPHPSLINVNIRRLIEAPSWHRHFKRTFGADMVSELRFNFAETACEKPGAGARGVVSMRAFPKEVYDWYESASLHTGKKKVPWRVWMVLACALLVPTFGYLAITGVYKNVTKERPQTIAASAAPGPGRAAVGAEGRVLTAAEYVDARVPRIPGFPHSAPVYDSVTQPVEAPYPAACVVMRGECKCYTQQATLLYMPEGLCKHIVERGFFVDFKLPSREAPRRSVDQSRQELRSVQPVQQQPPQQLQVVVAPLPQQDPGAAYLQGLSARNAQVRSGLQ